MVFRYIISKRIWLVNHHAGQGERIKNDYPQISQIYADFQKRELQNAHNTQYLEHVTSVLLEKLNCR